MTAPPSPAPRPTKPAFGFSTTDCVTRFLTSGPRSIGRPSTVTSSPPSRSTTGRTAASFSASLPPARPRPGSETDWDCPCEYPLLADHRPLGGGEPVLRPTTTRTTTAHLTNADPLVLRAGTMMLAGYVDRSWFGTTAFAVDDEMRAFPHRKETLRASSAPEVDVNEIIARPGRKHVLITRGRLLERTVDRKRAASQQPFCGAAGNRNRCSTRAFDL